MGNKLLRYLLRKELKDCKYQILSLETELGYAEDIDEKEERRLEIAYNYERAREKAIVTLHVNYT